METTRRDALAHGGRIIATAAVLPFLPAIKPAQAQPVKISTWLVTTADAELFALYAKYKRLEKVEAKASDRLHHALSEAGLNVSEVSESYLTAAELIRRRYSGRAKELERTGIPALEKKHEAAVNATKDALSRLYDVRANTPEGMILKLAIERADCDQRSWRAEGRPGLQQSTGAEYFSQGPSSVFMDLERLLSERRI